MKERQSFFNTKTIILMMKTEDMILVGGAASVGIGLYLLLKKPDGEGPLKIDSIEFFSTETNGTIAVDSAVFFPTEAKGTIDASATFFETAAKGTISVTGYFVSTEPKAYIDVNGNFISTGTTGTIQVQNVSFTSAG